MFFKLDSFALLGINAVKVAVEIHISNGLPSFSIVGLPDKTINESKDRVKASILNSGFKFPLKKIVINLSPADLKKEGPFYDLPIALCILALSGQVRHNAFQSSCFIGELSLDGKLNPVKGVLSMSEKAKMLGKTYFFVPEKNVLEASVINDMNIVSCISLNQLVEMLNDEEILKRNIAKPCNFKDFFSKQHNNDNNEEIDFKDVQGQYRAKRAMEISISGMHNILLVGPPGCGKSMLAERAKTIIPDLEFDESIEVTKIYSISKKYINNLMIKRPFRHPHHSITAPGMLGGGAYIKPGEISLAHRGILFLDEFTEFDSKIIESLRQPLENKKITITRSNFTIELPCFFMLIVAMNPCFCGYFGDKYNKCKCSKKDIEKYWKKISGPILDRIDMQINIPRLREEDYIKNEKSESSKEIKERIKNTFLIQFERNKKRNFKFNSEATPEILNTWINESSSIKDLLIKFSKKSGFSMRSVASIIKISRTIADIEGSKKIKEEHLAEAYQYKIYAK